MLDGQFIPVNTVPSNVVLPLREYITASAVSWASIGKDTVLLTLLGTSNGQLGLCSSMPPFVATTESDVQPPNLAQQATWIPAHTSPVLAVKATSR